MLTGSARLSQEAKERARVEERRVLLDAKRRERQRLEAVHREQALHLSTKLEAELARIDAEVFALEAAERQIAVERGEMAALRQAQERTQT